MIYKQHIVTTEEAVTIAVAFSSSYSYYAAVAVDQVASAVAVVSLVEAKADALSSLLSLSSAAAVADQVASSKS